MSFGATARYSVYAMLALGAFGLSATIPLLGPEPPASVAAAAAIAAIVPAATAETAPTPAPAAPAPALMGIASWYGEHWQGRKTASGTRFDTSKLTAAHRSLPLNTRVRVTNLLNGLSVEVLVNDRGPYVGERVLDLSEAAAKRLGMIKRGLAPVRIEAIAAQVA